MAKCANRARSVQARFAHLGPLGVSVQTDTYGKSVCTLVDGEKSWNVQEVCKRGRWYVEAPTAAPRLYIPTSPVHAAVTR
jgi:hypothetical protein